MTEAFKRGYLDKMAELRKRSSDLASGTDSAITDDEWDRSPLSENSGKPGIAIMNSAADQGIGLHQPVTPAQVSRTLLGPQVRRSILEDGHITSDGSLNLLADATMQKFLDTTSQKPSERMPTPYEAMLFHDAMSDRGYDEGGMPVYDDHDMNDAFQGALLNPESPLSEDVLRRIWASSTNTVPIVATSPAYTNAAPTAVSSPAGK